MFPSPSILSRAAARRGLIHPSSRLLLISPCIPYHPCRTHFSETDLPTSQDTVGPSTYLTKRHIATASPTMPPRNKNRASAHSEAQDNQETRPVGVPDPSEATSNGPRRSSRRIPASRVSPSTKESRTGNAKKQSLTDEMDVDATSSTPTMPVEDVARRLENDDPAAASALRRLEEMETSFKNDIKRRRLQIEQSIVDGASAGRLAPALKHRGYASGGSDVIHLDRVLLTPEEDRGHAYETAKDEESETGEELMETIKGANRPPAVNSDYLPLPWKGRLGYVSFP